MQSKMINSVRFLALLVAATYYACPVHCFDIFNRKDSEAAEDTETVTSGHFDQEAILQNMVSLFKIYQDSLSDNLNTSLIEFITGGASEECARDAIYTLRNLRSIWALQMLDAFGKPGSGLLDLDLQWTGDYYECTQVSTPPEEKNHTTARGFRGKYCVILVEFDITYENVPFNWGVCLPETCEPEDLINAIKRYLKVAVPESALREIQSSVTISSSRCNPVTKEYPASAIWMTILICIPALLALIGSLITAYEYYTRKPADEKSFIDTVVGHTQTTTAVNNHSTNQKNGILDKVKLFFNCFCFFTNGDKLLCTNVSSEEQMLCLHGIRFLSMCWVIVCHNYLFSLTTVDNYVEMIFVTNVWPFQLILNGFYSVDTFFEMSGFLMAYSFFKEAPKTDGKVPWLYFYLHRFLRLTPVYMIVLGFHTVLLPSMGAGPFWTSEYIDPVCQETWWWNLLYINNFLNAADQCIAWTWYLANDMQFFLISPLFLISLWRWPKFGCFILGLFFCMSTAVIFSLSYHFDLITGFGNFMVYLDDVLTFKQRFLTMFDTLYTKPYARIGPYLIGIGLASYLTYRKKKDQGKNHWITLTCGWMISTGMTLACLFAPFHRDQTTIEASFYNALNRSCFAFSLAWVIYTCLTQQSEVINNLLSWKFFLPLSRLTYCAYLIHPLIYRSYYTSMKAPLHFTQLSLVTIYFGLLILTYVTAFFMSLLFESPVIRLEKALRSK